MQEDSGQRLTEKWIDRKIGKRRTREENGRRTGEQLLFSIHFRIRTPFHWAGGA